MLDAHAKKHRSNIGTGYWRYFPKERSRFPSYIHHGRRLNEILFEIPMFVSRSSCVISSSFSPKAKGRFLEWSGSIERLASSQPLSLQLAIVISFHERESAMEPGNHLRLVHSLVHQINTKRFSGRSVAVMGNFRDISLAAVLRSFVDN